jgi:CYTH domain-containing protein
MALEVERKFRLRQNPAWLSDHRPRRVRQGYLWPLAEQMRIEKRRHLVPVDGLTAEVDVYEGPLAGLVLAEIEFRSQAESRHFQAPAWLGEEVTGEDRYSNRRLAEAGLDGGDQSAVKS